MTTMNRQPWPPKKPLLEQMRDALRARHYSIRTETSYLDWAKRFILFHHKRHPETMGASEVTASRSVTHLAVEKNVAASTQTQALSAILFLYRSVLQMDIDEPLDVAVIGCVVKRAYGSTEVPTLTAGHLEDDEDMRLSTDGRAIGEGEVRIVGADGADLPPGDEGEIWARAPEMLSGYAGGASERAFEPGGWFRTGDLGRLDAAGNLRVTGRLKDIIIRGGENISAREVEDILVRHPKIAQAAVTPVADEKYGEKVCAFVVPAGPDAPSLGDVLEHFKAEGVATQKTPERLEIVDAFPMTLQGKVKKYELRRLVEA
jgi:non-ribosomal peptide synthetase component E (peptide arylation enzyme)